VPRLPSLLATFVLAALSLAPAGCGGTKSAPIPGGSSSGGYSTTSSTPSPTTPAASPPAGPKPKIAKPSGPPPKKLKIIDLKKGTGPPVKAGDQVTVQYVGVLYKTGQQFDASYDTGQPFPFQLGAGSVIPGWDKGVAGMRAGGRRQLIIPPALAYGAQGSPPKIPPNSTLIFDIDLVKVG
jgi:peptidylprolyl isomerase